jgi:hypothetical protein
MLACSLARSLAHSRACPLALLSLARSLLCSFVDVTEAEREMVALVQLMITGLEKLIISTFSFDSDEALVSSSDKPELSRFIVRASDIYEVQAANCAKLEGMAIPHKPESEEARATQCSLLMAKIIQKAGPAAQLSRAYGGTIQTLRFVRAYQHEVEGGTPLDIASRLLDTLWRLCNNKRLLAINAVIKSTSPHLFAEKVPQRSAVVWPVHHKTRPRKRSSTEWLFGALTSSGKRTAKVLAAAGGEQHTREMISFLATPLHCGSSSSTSNIGMDSNVSLEAMESRDRFTLLAADFGLRPLLTFSHSMVALTSGLLFDESAVRKHDASALVAFWREANRVELALEWLFEFLETMLNAMSVRNGRMCYLQPVFKLDGSNDALRSLVLETLIHMNNKRYPPVFRSPPLVILAGHFTQADFAKRASAHYAGARFVRLADPAVARKELEAAGVDAAMLPVSLGGGRPDQGQPSFTSSDLPSLAELLECSFVLPLPLIDESGMDSVKSGMRGVNRRRSSRLTSTEWLGFRQGLVRHGSGED